MLKWLRKQYAEMGNIDPAVSSIELLWHLHAVSTSIPLNSEANRSLRKEN